MKAVLRRIIRGCGYLPTCGDHPGTGYLFLIVCMGAFAGAKKGTLGAFVGAGVMLVCLGIPYLIGAHDRGAIQEREDARAKAGREAK